MKYEDKPNLYINKLINVHLHLTKNFDLLKFTAGIWKPEKVSLHNFFGMFIRNTIQLTLISYNL